MSTQIPSAQHAAHVTPNGPLLLLALITTQWAATSLACIEHCLAPIAIKPATIADWFRPVIPVIKTAQLVLRALTIRILDRVVIVTTQAPGRPPSGLEGSRFADNASLGSWAFGRRS